MNAKRKEIIRLAQDAVALLRKTEPAMLYERGAGKQEARDEEGTQHRELGFLGKDADPKAECKAGLLQTAQGVLAHHGKNKMAADCYMQAHSHYGRAYDCAMAGDEAGCGEHMEAARKVHAQADGMGMDADKPKHDPANGQFVSSGGTSQKRTPSYSAESVNKAIAASNRAGRKICFKEAKLIDAILKGRLKINV